MACARHGRTAALAAPFKPKDAELFAIISNFDAAYSAYNGFQSSLERYWTLKHLQQHAITELDCAVMVNGLVRADTLPLVFKALGCENLPRHAKVRVRVTGIDELTLDVHASLLTRLDDDATSGEGEPEAEDDAEVLDNAGPLTLAIDLSDSEGEAPASAPAA